MRPSLVRFALLSGVIAAVVSCDAGPTVTRFGNGISGGPTGTAPLTPPAPGSPDSNVPLARFIAPPTASPTLVNVGDSIFVSVRLNDDRALGSVTITGFKETGDPNLGTFVRTPRYTPVTAPATGTFRPGLTDTTITRYLKPAVPLDTTIGTLFLEAAVTDSAGNTYTARLGVSIVTGPKLTITAPTGGDSVPVGVPMSVAVRTTHPDGVDSLIIITQGENTAAWPTKLADTVRVKFPPATKDTTYTVSVTPPGDAPLRGRVTISASARDINRNPGSAAPVLVFLRARGTLAPRVYQTVPLKLEMDDSITVTASGDGITQIGIVLVDRDLGTVVTGGDTVTYTAPFTSNRTEKLALNLGIADQGRRLDVYSFAVDNNTPPNTGWSLKAGISVPVTTQSAAQKDTTLITHGRTFAPPRAGVIGDVVVHPNGNAFLSNTRHNLLEVWNNTSKTFTSSGVAVGAQPWGLALGLNDDTLFVANSGATTISRVCVENCAGGVPVEDLNTTPGAGRIRTRNNVVFVVDLTIDENGGINLTIVDQVSYSDRPQYVVQSAGGRIFYSTRPTSANTAGTIRWLDPALPIPDPRQIWSYGRELLSEVIRYAIFNVDSIEIVVAPASTPASDQLRIFDHPYGAATGSVIVQDSMPVDVVAKAVAGGSDAEAVYRLDVSSLALTDTTFVSASIDRKWVAFGEGNTKGGTGRIMMINDPPGVIPGYFSPAQTVTDIVHNASEQVFGLAVDSAGLQAAVHGLKTYTASVDVPFHLRLDGEYDSFDDGAGVAFHPRANSTGSLPDFRLAFSATASGIVEIIDVAHYNNRGRLITKGNLYGALRATSPLPGDPPGVILKLFGLTAEGLIVIDLRAPDIKPSL